MLALWGTILRRIPNARLRLSLSGGAEHNRSMLPIIEAAGLDLARVDLLGRLGYQQFLAAYNDIDIALTPSPTTAEPPRSMRSTWVCLLSLARASCPCRAWA
jgi:predicted O-linked N-acetylglucosamine transferase (SPINDLY family)